jgi:putative addiction module component (TIGR02574 family)
VNMSRIELGKLSNAEKILLVERIWDSIDKKSVELTTTQKKELDRRLEKYSSGEMKFSTWEEVKARLENNA